MKSRLLLILFLISSTSLFAQGDSQLNYFKGGTYRSSFSFSNSLFMGIGSHVGGMGGDYGGLVRNSETVLWNPANLSFLKSSQISLDVKPNLMFDPQQFFDLDKEIRAQVDDNIADFRGPNLVLEDDDYPSVTMKLGEKTSVGTGSFAFKYNGYTIGGALFEPLRLSFDLVGSGFELQMETLDADDPTKDVTFFSSVDMNLFANARIEGLSLGVSREIKPRWSVGLSAERLIGTAEMLARFQVEGIMLIAGNERAFNDPNDPWENTMHSSYDGKYRGSSTSLRLGTTYKFSRNWGVGVAASLGHKLRMNGMLNAQRYQLVGLNLDAAEDEDLLDATEIDLDEPTKTVKRDSMIADVFEVRFPGTIGVGLSGKAGFLGVSINYERYFGQLSYYYKVKRGSVTDDYYNALKLENAVRLGLDFKLLRLGLGVALGKYFDEVGSQANGTDIIVPNLSLGTGIKIGSRMGADVLFVAVPSGVGKITFHYRL